MIQLDDPKWSELDGGYRVPYNASIALTRLKKENDTDAIATLFKELWDELHHQGDVGLASYYAVPYIIRIAREKSLYDFNVFGLVSTIEIERHGNNPRLPEELKEEYLSAITQELPSLAKDAISNEWDSSLGATILASLAVAKGQIELAKAILLLEDADVLKEFLGNY